MTMEETIKAFETQLTFFNYQRDSLTEVITELDHLIMLCKEFVEVSGSDPRRNR